MAYVNVKDWSVEQVIEWLKGLGDVILPYTLSFLNNGITGHQLLNLRADDLDNLGVKSLGHQEIILESVEHLRHFHFELDKENLQRLALKVSCASNALFKELLLIDDDSPIISLQMMSDVHNISVPIKRLVFWLDRVPFLGDKEYIDCKTQLLDLSFEMVTTAHRGQFSEKPVSSIKQVCEKITKIADHIVQEISDPMILQPAFLDLATLKKKEQELGFYISPNNHPIHQIVQIKYGSPAHSTTKIEEGDEIVQVNYQTIVGWQRKYVTILLQQSPPEIVLTLKKRPRHTKVYGQIYMKPYRLPSKKLENQQYFSWNENIAPPTLMPIQNLLIVNIPKLPVVIEPADIEEDLSSSDDDSESPDNSDSSGRMYLRPMLQRRNTITGVTPTSKRPFPSFDQCWQIWKDRTHSHRASSFDIDDDNFDFDPDSRFLRDKSASCNLDVELSPRPTTVIGISPSRTKKSFRNQSKERPLKKQLDLLDKKSEKIPHNVLDNDNAVGLNDKLITEPLTFIDEGRDLADRASMGLESADTKPLFNIAETVEVPLAEVKVRDIVKKIDGKKEEAVKPKIYPRSQIKETPNIPQMTYKGGIKKPIVPPRTMITKMKGKVDPPKVASSDTQCDSLVKSTFPVHEQKVPTKSNNVKLAPFTEIKYELGIPICEARNSPKTTKLPEEKHEEEADVTVPPQPPPRTLMLGDVNKFAHLPDCPKPRLPSKLKSDIPTIKVKHVEASVPIGDFSATNVKVSETPPAIKLNDEPLVITTPPSKLDWSRDSEWSGSKHAQSSHVHKNVGESNSSSSLVRAMIHTQKNKNLKKRNNIVARRRKITTDELNPCDNQGYLYQRLRNKHNQNIHWEKRWFVVLGSCLYGFKTKEDTRAACLIFLSGFTVAVANEVKSRSNAFKVYHTGTAFYFSTEDSESLQTWIEVITAATLNNETLKISEGTLYSETDDESDSDRSKKEKQPENLKKSGSLKKNTSKKQNTVSGSTSLDRKRFFNKSSSHSKNSLPVPTAQFRSYRKIKTNVQSESVTTGNFTSHIAFFTPRSGIPILQQPGQNSSVPNLSIEHFGKEPDIDTASLRASKGKPSNYVHASNPSLRNINDFVAPTFPTKTFKKFNDNLVGFVTLEELMIRQSEERKSNPYHVGEEDSFVNFDLIQPDVVYGEVHVRPKEQNEFEKQSDISKREVLNTSRSQIDAENDKNVGLCFGKRTSSKSQQQAADIDFKSRVATYPKTAKGLDKKTNRSLPRASKVTEPFESEDRTGKNMILSDRSYEMIFCAEKTTDIQFAQNRNLEDRMYKDSQKKQSKFKKQHSFRSLRQNSPMAVCPQEKLNSTLPPMYLPSSYESKTKPKLTFESNLDDKVTKDGKSKQNERKRTFLGSPQLNRWIFKRNVPSETHSTSASLKPPPISTLPTVENQLSSDSLSISTSPHVDYPGLEYPPVFEPETYSLADPQSSLTLLRKQSKNSK